MYSYTQWSSKVVLSIEVPSETRSEDVNVVFTETSLVASLKGPEEKVLIKGRLVRAIVPLESDWRLVRGGTASGSRSSSPSDARVVVGGGGGGGGNGGNGSGSSADGTDLASSTSSLVKITQTSSESSHTSSEGVLVDLNHHPSPPDESSSPISSTYNPSPPSPPTLFAEYRTSSTSSASDEDATALGVGTSERRAGGKVLVMELRKHESGDWEGGLIVVGPVEGEGWGGMDQVSLVGLALERLGRGEREEGEEMLSYLQTTSPFNPLSTHVLTTSFFPPPASPTQPPTPLPSSKHFPPKLLAQLYIHEAQTLQPNATARTQPNFFNLPFPLPRSSQPITPQSLLAAALSLDPTLVNSVPSSLQPLLNLTDPQPKPKLEHPRRRGASSSSSSTSSSSRPSRTGEKRPRRRGTTPNPVPPGNGGGGGGEGDWTVWIAVTVVGLVLVAVAIWPPGKGGGGGGGGGGGKKVSSASSS